ncbi:dentin sialophosphoprotein precursor, putative [Trichomonas vaginalis G3]|uniref:Dentin sialophosphoprotein, putative n=1 Tax=Trichomonas vaginalis (strain ATCC PRA-98 / G3) TaxID=412133 RepID=A2F1Z3_TRIV3|nr:hypothetical protein TVAGG3_0128130 [Trichomonas vaginalis G3]EAY01091.1 dentin sialophosphoprotein precursor, putative [Trichomonas vaginalis G3]KAI5545908.1 hypothetical protein TVAGG3_0128130 [Trichomonas vaginalis G3]|eukprot:XP_001330107.1 dentin sialophosphoprotein precursor [Trichomonas vaginalis G3]
MKQKELTLKLQMFDLPLKQISAVNLDEGCQNNLETGIEFFIRLDCFQAFQQTPLYIYLTDSKKHTHCACGFDICTTLVESYQNTGMKFTYQLNIPLENKNQTQVGSINIEYSLVHFSSDVESVSCLDREPEKVVELQKPPEPAPKKPKPKKKRELPVVNPREADVYQLNIHYRKTREQLKKELIDLEKKVRTIEDSKRRHKIRRATQIEDLTATSSRIPSMINDDPFNHVEIITDNPPSQRQRRESSSNSTSLSKPIKAQATISHIASKPSSREQSQEAIEKLSLVSSQMPTSKESSKASYEFDSSESSSFSKIIDDTQNVSDVSRNSSSHKMNSKDQIIDAQNISDVSRNSSSHKMNSKDQIIDAQNISDVSRNSSSHKMNSKDQIIDTQNISDVSRNSSSHKINSKDQIDDTFTSTSSSHRSRTSSKKSFDSTLLSDTNTSRSSNKVPSEPNTVSALNDTTSTLPSFLKSTLKSSIQDEKKADDFSSFESNSSSKLSSSKKSHNKNSSIISSKNSSEISGKNSKVSRKSNISSSSDIISESFT